VNQTNGTDQHIELSARQYLPIVCMAVLGVVASFVLFWLVHGWEQAYQQSEFETRVKAYSSAVESTLSEYVGALLFLGDFFNNSSAGVTRQEFTSFVNSVLPRYPGIQAFSWNPLVTAEERTSYESAARGEGFPDFEFTERSETKKLVRAARRPEFVVVYYIHPLGTNRAALGFDIASNPTRRKAISKGFETGKLSATGRITLVQETGNQFGVLLLMPIYQQGAPISSPDERNKSRKGFVVEVLRIGDAVEAALKGFSDEGISLTLYDASADQGERFLYHRPTRMSKTANEPIPEDSLQPDLFWSKTFDFGERQWKLVLSPSDFYFQSRRLYQAWIVFLGSLLLTMLLAFYMLKRLRYTMDIERRVKLQAQTNELLKNEIAERKKAHEELDKTIANLQLALDEIKTLRGILPICSFCKKIRNDKGYWEQVDVYIHRHSQADISHGICPDCQQKHYPEEYNDTNSK